MPSEASPCKTSIDSVRKARCREGTQSRAEREDLQATHQQEVEEGLRSVQTAEDIALQRERTKRLLNPPVQAPMTTGYIARSQAKQELSDSESELTQRRKKAPLALSKKEIRERWGGDILSLPDTRNQSRKALAELRNAAKRRRKRLQVEREEEEVRLAEEQRRLEKRGPQVEGPAPAPDDESVDESEEEEDSSEDEQTKKSALAESVFPLPDMLQ